MTQASNLRQDDAPADRVTPYAQVMKIWASWQTLKDRKEAGGFSHPQDAKDFMRTGEAVESFVNDLPTVQWWAVRKAAGVYTAVWRFPNTSLSDALEDAEATLTMKFRNNRDTARYFHA